MKCRPTTLLAAMLAAGIGLTPAPNGAQAESLAGAYLAAQQANFRSEFVEAARYYTRAAQAAPDNLGLLQNAIITSVIADDFATAIPLARRAQQLGGEPQLSGLVLVTDAVREEDYDTAQARLDDATLRMNPLVEGLLNGWVAVGRGDVAAAIAAFDALAEETSFAPIAAYHKALVMAMVGNFDGAIEIFEANGDGGLRLNRAAITAHVQILMQLDRRDEAAAILAAIPGAANDPNLVDLMDAIEAGEEVPFTHTTSPLDGVSDVFLTLATALNQDEADRFSLLYARLAQVVKPGNEDAILFTADVFDRIGQYDLAVRDFAKIPQTSLVFRDAEIGRAGALSASGASDEATIVLDALSESYPQDRFVHVSLGDLLRREENFAEASEAYTKAIDLITDDRPQDWRVYYVRAITYERTDRWDAAEADFRKALELNPEQPLVLNYLGYSLVEKGLNIDEAKDMIERAVSGDPDNGYITDSLGWVLYRLDRFEEAVPHLERAAELLPTDPVINDHLGDVYWQVGRKTEATFQWKRALSFDPEEVDATRIRRKLEAGLDVVLEEEAAAK